MKHILLLFLIPLCAFGQATYTNSSKSIMLYPGDVADMKGAKLTNGVYYGNGSGLTGIVAQYISGKLTNSISGNADTATAATTATNALGGWPTQWTYASITNSPWLLKNINEGSNGLANSSIAIGQGAGESWQSTDLYNVAIGIDALKNSTGNGENVEYPGYGGFNVAIGNGAMEDATTAFSCTAVGFQAGGKITTGYSNTGLGRSALYETTTGIYNTAVGYQSLYGNVSGSANTAVGLKSLSSLVGGSGVSGYGNVAVGWNAGHGFNDCNENSILDGFCTFLGFQASRDISVSTNTQLLFSTAIGANAKVARSYAIVLGGTGTYQQNVGIKTTDPVAPLNVGKISNNYSGQANVIFATEDENKAALMLSNWTGDYTTNGIRLVFDNSTRGQWTIGSSSSANNFDICREWGTPDYRIDASGNSLFSNEINVTKAARYRFHQYLLNKAGDGWLPFAVRNTSGSEAVYDLSNVGTLDISGAQYSHSSHFILNKAGTGWLQYATRNTTGADAVMDLANVGNITASNYYGNGSNLTGLVPFANPTFTGTITADSLNISGTAYYQGSMFCMNKATNAWLSLMVRDVSGSEAKYNMESIGNINAESAIFTNNVTAGNVKATGNFVASDNSTGISATNIFAATGTNWTMVIKNGLITSMTHSP